MNEPILALPLAGQAIGSADGDFVVAGCRDAGGYQGPPRLIATRHLHHRDEEAWHVLEGILCVQRGDEVVEAGAGAAVFVPRGTPHTYWNPGPGPVRYPLVMTANIYRLIQAIRAMPEHTPALLRAVFQRHDSELLET